MVSRKKAQVRLERDFERRASYSPDSVLTHLARGWRYVPVHPFADEADVLERIGAKPEECKKVDAYWLCGRDVYFLQVYANGNEPDTYSYRWSEGKLSMFNLVAKLTGALLTREMFEKAMEQLSRWLPPMNKPKKLTPFGSVKK